MREEQSIKPIRNGERASRKLCALWSVPLVWLLAVVSVELRRRAGWCVADEAQVVLWLRLSCLHPQQSQPTLSCWSRKDVSVCAEDGGCGAEEEAEDAEAR